MTHELNLPRFHRSVRAAAAIVALTTAVPPSAALTEGDISSVIAERASSGKRRTLLGAAIGAAVGAASTALVLHTGGSTARCDRNANQDAIGRRECAGLIALGGAVGGGVGALVGRQFSR